MAGPLRRVSQNYQWTLKRANNDLHNSIIPDPQPALASSKIDTIGSPWDSAHLQWKFKTEYAELREHLEQSFLILLGWWMTFKYLTKAAIEHFIARSDQAISDLYDQSTKFTIDVTLLISFWGLLAALFRYAVPRVAFSTGTKLFLSLSAIRFGANKREEIGTHPVSSPSPKQALPDERPVQSPSVKGTTHAPPGPEGGITAMSDPAHSTLDASLIDSLKDGIEKPQSAMHGEGRPLHDIPRSGCSPLDGDIKKPPE